ncbi:sulfatase family protein [Zobellia galactanivorans]|uniref:Sulfatase, family S1-23 n=1 Tax=Zobellia galactanivorans (strain DSM 12802 / CCUG 47099 / CIP 106680 / NCIMB 13871 / Dsij) TaxID=63186 RepID=G0LA11_ZOBGA|nr:sulfatase-like hydrolase/transferase [Zobellia galactanivorans]CAZ94976.1 Sulfatase, family S1-23 [Zobellia galactanivorans]
MKSIIRGLLAVSVLIGCSEKPKKQEVAPVAQETPNIILLMADDQGWGDVGYNGHPHLKTPNLDAMAAEGAVFERFYAASAVCSPTRGSVMTGRHPLRYGICHANCGHIKPEEITLGEMVKGLGYTTGHFGKWHLGTLTRDTIEANRGGRPKFDGDYAPPWDHGFDVSFVTESKVPTWNPMVTPPKSSGDVSGNLKEGMPFNTSYWTGPGEIAVDNLEGDDSRVIMDRAIPFIEKAVKNKKAFLSIIWFHTPHLPVLTGDEERKSYTGLSEDQQHYYGVISAMDKQIGRLRNRLKDLGVAENTVLFYTSDNGPEGKSVGGRTQGVTKGLKGRKRSLNEGGIRVPGIMEWTGRIKPGTKVEAPCFTSDYFPTIANILGVDLAENNRPYDGVDMFPFVSGEQKRREKPLAFDFQGQAALIDNEYKIYSDDKGKNFTLYNLQNDAAESVDLAEEQPEKFNEMLAYWHQWKTSQKRSALGEDY